MAASSHHTSIGFKIACTLCVPNSNSAGSFFTSSAGGRNANLQNSPGLQISVDMKGQYAAKHTCCICSRKLSLRINFLISERCQEPLGQHTLKSSRKRACSGILRGLSAARTTSAQDTQPLTNHTSNAIAHLRVLTPHFNCKPSLPAASMIRFVCGIDAASVSKSDQRPIILMACKWTYNHRVQCQCFLQFPGMLLHSQHQ